MPTQYGFSGGYVPGTDYTIDHWPGYTANYGFNHNFWGNYVGKGLTAGQYTDPITGAISGTYNPTPMGPIRCCGNAP